MIRIIPKLQGSLDVLKSFFEFFKSRLMSRNALSDGFSRGFIEFLQQMAKNFIIYFFIYYFFEKKYQKTQNKSPK